MTISLQDTSEYKKIVPHFIWIPTSRDTVISKEMNNEGVLFAAFAQDSSNERVRSSMHPHSLEW